MDQNPQSQLKLLIAQGKEQGYLTYAEVNDSLPEELVDADQIEDIIQMINDMGIQVLEAAPDADDLMLNENIADEDVVEEATQVLSSVEAELGRTTDPVRMYMREMGSVELLTREAKLTSPNASKKASTKCKAPLPPILKPLPISLTNMTQWKEGKPA